MSSDVFFNLRNNAYSIMSLLADWFLLDYIIVILYYHQPIAFILVFTSSVRIYIGHMADSSKPYCYRLVSASAGITPSTCQLIGYLIYCQLHDQTDWKLAPHQDLDLHWS